MIGRRGGRGGRGSHQPPNQHDSPNRERDLRDIEVDDLRRQVQQLQQRLEHFEPLEHDVSRHDSENEPTDEENTNPFGRDYDRASNDGNNRRHRHMNNFIRPNFDVKFHNFKQKDLSVEEYTSEFDNQRMLCDITEPDEQTIARYLGGLRTDISNIVQLQPYWTYNDVVKLSLKVEKQIREGRGGSSRSWIRENNTNRASVSTTKAVSSTNIGATPKATRKQEGAASSSNRSSSIRWEAVGIAEFTGVGLLSNYMAMG
ncbi:hypothetical protein LWI29_017342 [Acer saccharum]|uniref:Retrotransposon gag domain-containing protein n=1 Tax=Acer saccharum TaxID=4024 RepID=A0AA39T3D8_ACESA|nr:hypothetical protein LWI29_017342 [Acer saccharum]